MGASAERLILREPTFFLGSIGRSTICRSEEMRAASAQWPRFGSLPPVDPSIPLFSSIVESGAHERAEAREVPARATRPPRASRPRGVLSRRVGRIVAPRLLDCRQVRCGLTPQSRAPPRPRRTE